jgi:hypothetical protein
MARRGRGFRTQAPTAITLFVAVVLWVIGFADVIVGVLDLSGTMGVWFLAIAGLLLILGSLVDGI